ncbi:T9SS type A sorting domain-containing protein [Maribellus mangrovi]|uniref:T9SS type A sorting domain-containing protein n=1 Tax=Maribellus mangrovi TaxID=3133146 RepID=UPI0030EE996C
MKTFTFILTLLIMIWTQSLLAQKVVVIGINHNSTSPNTDGFSFLAAENLLVGDIIYFTENEYSNAGNAFVNLEEGVVAFTVTSAINTGNVVFISETGTSTNTFSISSSSGNGTAVKTNSSGSFSIASGGESLYAYSDVDEDPSNGVTEIYSVLCTGSGEIPTATGGNIPADLDPTNDYANAVVVDGFTYGSVPDRLEFNTGAGDRTNVNQTMLENPTNYTTGTAVALSTQSFTNFSLSESNPVLTVSASPASVNENSGSSITYTFSLSANATSNITINFSVGGTATFTTDYTQSGATTFNASSGTVTISSGTNSADITLTPVSDDGLEPDETIVLTLKSGTGYDAGSPSSASGTIVNDDTQAVMPLVAITGTNQNDPEGFSFVALDDISSGTVIYFTENSFDNSSLAFSGTEAVLSWTSPGTDVLRGEVIAVKEDPAGTFTASSQSGNNGSISLVSGTLSYASTGEQFYAYTDSDSDPTNGVTEVHSVLFTGTTTTSGGNIPSSEDPSTVFTSAVVVDGFAATAPNRTEYDPAKRNVTVDNANFQNVGNWLHGQANQDLSEVPFSNIIISKGSASPTVTLAVSPSDVVEDAVDTLFYTFTMSAPASGDITINFDVAGTANFSTDYTVDGASSFTASSGSAVIANGTSTAVVSLVPVGDSDVETQESVQLIITSGTGYDGGSPNDATGTISNDDTSTSDPLVAITGLNHESPDGFSFVAAQDIPASTTIYFTDNSFDNTTLMFSSGEAVLSWTSPSTIVPSGQVIVVTETSPDVFSVTRSNGSTETGSITLESGNLALATDGETFYAYEDDDNDPTNGVVDIYSVLYTGVVASSGGAIPASEDPSGIYVQALVVDGFAATAPNRTEYDPTKRNVLIEDVDFEDISNWLFAQTNQTLSNVPFDNLNIVIDYNTDPSITGLPANITVLEDTPTPVNIASANILDDSGDSIITLTIEAGSGVFFLANAPNMNFNGNASGYITISGSLANINNYLDFPTNIQYSAPQDLSGNDATTLTLTINDNGFTGLGGGSDVVLGTVNIDITPVNDPPVITNVYGDSSTEIEVGNGAQSISDLNDATVSDVDSPDMNGGYLSLNQTSGTANGNFGMDGTTVTSGGDATIAAGETVAVGGTAIGTVHATNDGQGGNTLEIDFNSANSTNANIQSLLRNLSYSAPSGIDSRTFILTLNDGDGTANGGSNQTSGSFTINVVLFEPDIALKTGRSYINVGDTIDFGDVEMGDQSDTTIFVLNEGNADLTLYSIGQAPAFYSFNTAGIKTNLIPSDSTSFGISLQPVQLGENISLISVGSDDPDESNYSFFVKSVGVVDSTPPTVVCQDLSIWLDQSGTASVTAPEIDNGSTDISGIDSMWLNKYDFTAADLGSNLITLYVSDVNGNADSCTAIVTIGDNIAPDVECNPITIYMDENGEYPLTDDQVAELSNGTTDNVSAPENLNIYALANSNVFNCNENGHQIVVQVFAVDEAGNRSNCIRLINVIDTFPLSMNPVDDIEVYLGAARCDTTISISYPELTTNNKCAEFAQISGLGPDGVFPVGTTEEKWLLSNSKGDSLEFSFNVIVTSDNLAPALDPIADIDTTSTVSEFIIPLTGISYGADCAGQEIAVSASGINSDVVNNISVDYTSPEASGELTLSIPAAANGSDTITVNVEDSEGGTVSRTFAFTIYHINQVPMVMNALSDQELIADRELKIPFNDSLFVDNDGDSLLIEFALEDELVLPAWFEVMNDTLYITPSIADTGCISVVITATDPSLASVSDTFAVCVKGFPVGVGEINNNELSLNMFPNPSKGLVTIEFDTQVADKTEVLVTDIAGKQILKKSYLASKLINLNLSDQVSGMYLVNVQANGQHYMRKLILNKR